MKRLNCKKLEAILAALAGGGFDGLDPSGFEAARNWAAEQLVECERPR